MRIIKGTETILIDHPVFLVFGQPGICKSSLAYSARDPLLLDFDHGSHRAVNRRDTLQIDTWDDVAELMSHANEVLAPYCTVIPDTVGRCLDVMTADIIKKQPKLARDGNLTQQGWGVLKSRFRIWISTLRALGKDVLLVAHDREDKDGDMRIVRPDIMGGSYGEVMKVADFIAYLYMSGHDRVLDFSPSDRWIGKNPAGWQPFVIPPIEKAQNFLAGLVDLGRTALGRISEESAQVASSVEGWRQTIDRYVAADELTAAIPNAAILSPVMAPQVKKLLLDRAKVLGLTYSTAKRAFVPVVQAGPERAQSVGVPSQLAPR